MAHTAWIIINYGTHPLSFRVTRSMGRALSQFINGRSILWKLSKYNVRQVHIVDSPLSTHIFYIFASHKIFFEAGTFQKLFFGFIWM